MILFSNDTLAFHSLCISLFKENLLSFGIYLYICMTWSLQALHIFINYMYVFEYLEWCLNYLLTTKRRQLILKRNRHPSKNHTLLVFVISRVKQYNNYSYILVWKSGALDIEIRKIEFSIAICMQACIFEHAYLLHVKWFSKEN